MSDLISRSALLEEIHNAGGCGAAKGSWDDGYDRGISVAYDIVETVPAVDAVPVVHGEWEEIRNAYGKLEGWIHTDCGREVKCKERYCPSCGAKMDGGVEMNEP